MTTLIRFACPSCQAVLTAPPEHAGMESTCGKCGRSLRLPTGNPVPHSSQKTMKRTEGFGDHLVWGVRAFLWIASLLVSIIILLSACSASVFDYDAQTGRVFVSEEKMNDRLVKVVFGGVWVIVNFLVLIAARLSRAK